MMRTTLHTILCAGVALAGWGLSASYGWQYEAVSGFVASNAPNGYPVNTSLLKDDNRIRTYDAVVDHAGNVFITAGNSENNLAYVPGSSPSQFEPISGGVTIFKPDGLGGWNVVDVDLSPDGLNIPGGITNLVVAGDGKVYGVQNWIEINWDFARDNTCKILRFNPDGTVEVIWDATYGSGPGITGPSQDGGIELFCDLGSSLNRERDKIRGLTIGGDGNLYWTMNGDINGSGTPACNPIAGVNWRYQYFWRFKVNSNTVEKWPVTGKQTDGAATRLTDLVYVEKDRFVMIYHHPVGGSSAIARAQTISWTTGMQNTENGDADPVWWRGIVHFPHLVYDRVWNNLWLGPRGGDHSIDPDGAGPLTPVTIYNAFMARWNGDTANEGLLSGIEAIPTVMTGIQSTNLWMLNGNNPDPRVAGTTDNGGAYWTSALAVHPTTGTAWMSWGADTTGTAGRNYNESTGPYSPTGRVYTVGRTDAAPSGDKGRPYDAHPTQSANANQVVALAFWQDQVYAVCVDMVTGQFSLFSQTDNDAVLGACCLSSGCQQQPEGVCLDLGGVWAGAGVDCSAVNCTYQICHDPFADADGDGDVDQADFGVMQSCASPAASPPPSLPILPYRCTCYDTNTSGAVDETDLSVFLLCSVISGPDIPVNAACDD